MKQKSRRSNFVTVEQLEKNKENDLRLNGHRLSDCPFPLKSDCKNSRSTRFYPDHRFILTVLDKDVIELTMPVAIYGYLLQEEILPTKSKPLQIELTRKNKLIGYFELVEVLYDRNGSELMHLKLKILDAFDINMVEQKLLE